MDKINKIKSQILFWGLILGIQYLFSSHITAFPHSLLFLANTGFFTAFLFYGNMFFIFPKFNDGHSNKFLTVSVIMILILALCNGYIDLQIFNFVDARPPEKFKYPFLPSFMKSLFWLMLVQMVSTIFMLQEDLRKKSEETKVVVEEKLNTELKYLKAQINPHFLFNALNNIYSLTYLKSEKGPDAVLKLSAMLRYVLEDCQADHVRLGSEVEYIENFIDFQQMKSQGVQKIEFDRFGINDSVLVAPMLFVPFIENSFKYSKIENLDDAFVHMKLETNENRICFEIINSIPMDGKANSGSGKGIKNTKQRLAIVYPGKHELDIHETENEFTVVLKIQRL